MKKSIFDYVDYKAYVNATIRQMPQGGRGFRARVADFLGCQRAFVSHVLQGEAHFNLEHGDGINRMLHHSWGESQYFLLMIQLARAGTASLREHLQRQMKELQTSRLQLKNRLSADLVLTQEDAHRYYSSWIYGAIRVAVTIPGLRTKEALAERLKIPISRLVDALEFLAARGFIEQRGQEYFAGSIYSHLGNDSSLVAKHHTNWRVRALSSLDLQREDDLHYSSVFSLSAADLRKIKASLVAIIEDIQAEIKPSPEETLVSFCLDWYEV